MSAFSISTGEKVTISGGTNRCSCGCFTINPRYEGIATDEYAVVRDDGVLRRKFVVPDGVPACKCFTHVWLSDKDGPCTHPLFDEVRTPSKVLTEWTKELNELAEMLEVEQKVKEPK